MEAPKPNPIVAAFPVGWALPESPTSELAQHEGRMTRAHQLDAFPHDWTLPATIPGSSEDASMLRTSPRPALDWDSRSSTAVPPPTPLKGDGQARFASPPLFEPTWSLPVLPVTSNSQGLPSNAIFSTTWALPDVAPVNGASSVSQSRHENPSRSMTAVSAGAPDLPGPAAGYPPTVYYPTVPGNFRRQDDSKAVTGPSPHSSAQAWLSDFSSNGMYRYAYAHNTSPGQDSAGASATSSNISPNAYPFYTMTASSGTGTVDPAFQPLGYGVSSARSNGSAFSTESQALRHSGNAAQVPGAYVRSGGHSFSNTSPNAVHHMQSAGSASQQPPPRPAGVMPGARTSAPQSAESAWQRQDPNANVAYQMGNDFGHSVSNQYYIPHSLGMPEAGAAFAPVEIPVHVAMVQPTDPRLFAEMDQLYAPPPAPTTARPPETSDGIQWRYVG